MVTVNETFQRMNIVDCHHHLWDLDHLSYPWLTDQVRQVAYGDYSAIRKNYLLSDYRCDIGALNVVKSVHVQADHDPSDPVAETRWLQHIADAPQSNGFPHAIVAFVDLSRPDVDVILDSQMKFPNVRGIRQMLNYGPMLEFMDDPAWQANLAKLASRGLSFDLQIQPAQITRATELIASTPEVQFILDHAGCPPGSPKDTQIWSAGIAQLAKRPNVAVKLSGFGMFDQKWTAESITPIVRHIIDHFGPERCMFGSNFPVDSLMRAYRLVWEAFDASVATLASEDREQLFGKTAERIYRI
jgi:predicted TIM-barrel fold metal-dependent hydrolase